MLLAGCVPPDLGREGPPLSLPVPPAAPAPAPPVITPVPEVPEALPGSVEPQPPSVRLPPPGLASQSLLNQSRRYQAAGQYAQAAAAVERALRIEPRQPILWLELGQIHLQEGDFAQAETLGRKALSLSAGDPTLRVRAEKLIQLAEQR